LFKGCAIIAALFLSGVALFVGGFVYEVAYAGHLYQDSAPQPQHSQEEYDRHSKLARRLEVSGIAIAFGAIFGGAAWGFYKRQTSGEEPFQRRDSDLP